MYPSVPAWILGLLKVCLGGGRSFGPHSRPSICGSNLGTNGQNLSQSDQNDGIEFQTKLVFLWLLATERANYMLLSDNWLQRQNFLSRSPVKWPTVNEWKMAASDQNGRLHVSCQTSSWLFWWFSSWMDSSSKVYGETGTRGWILFSGHLKMSKMTAGFFGVFLFF